MSHFSLITNTKKASNHFNVLEVYSIFEGYFEKQKNPKIFLFFLMLVNMAHKQESAKIFFNILTMSYKYDVCEKTIKLWVKELERLKLIKFQFKNKQLHFVEVLDYKQSKLYQSQEYIPTRFYKNVAQILREITKNNINKTFMIDGEAHRINPPSKKLFNKMVRIEFQSKEYCQCYRVFNYEILTNKPLPPLNNPYHLKIIKSNIKKSLELLSS